MYMKRDKGVDDIDNEKGDREEKRRFNEKR